MSFILIEWIWSFILLSKTPDFNPLKYLQTRNFQHDGLPHCTTNNVHSSPIIQNNESIIAAVYPRGTNSPTKSKKNDSIFQSSRSPLSSLHNSTKIHRHDSNKSARRKLFSSGNYDSNNSSSSSSTLFSLPHQSLLHGILTKGFQPNVTLIMWHTWFSYHFIHFYDSRHASL